jgi:hypothetical protein
MKNKGQVSAWEILIIVLLVGVLGAIIWYSVTKPTESNKAKVMYQADDHAFIRIGGCIRYSQPQDKDVNIKVNPLDHK